MSNCQTFKFGLGGGGIRTELICTRCNLHTYSPKADKISVILIVRFSSANEIRVLSPLRCLPTLKNGVDRNSIATTLLGMQSEKLYVLVTPVKPFTKYSQLIFDSPAGANELIHFWERGFGWIIYDKNQHRGLTNLWLKIGVYFSD